MEVVGIKIALTSPDAQARVGTDRPIWGWLTDAMEVSSGDVIDKAASLLRAEAELVILLGQDIVGPGITGRDVLAATAAICPGIELPARYGDGLTPTAADLITRNAMACLFVVGSPVTDWRHLDLSLLGVVMDVNGEPACSGCSASVLGHPANAVAAVANDLARQERGVLRAGQLIFTGGITPPVALAPGMTIDANFAHLGHVGLSVAADSES